MTNEEYVKGTEIQIKLDEVKWALKDMPDKEGFGISYLVDENPYLFFTFKRDQPFIYSRMKKLLEEYKEYLEKEFEKL